MGRTCMHQFLTNSVHSSEVTICPSPLRGLRAKNQMRPSLSPKIRRSEMGPPVMYLAKYLNICSAGIPGTGGRSIKTFHAMSNNSLSMSAMYPGSSSRILPFLINPWSSLRNLSRNSAPSSLLSTKKGAPSLVALQGTQRVPSKLGPFPGTAKWTCG